jgi:hypothetical protein
LILFSILIGLGYLMVLGIFAGGLWAIMLLLSAAFNNPDLDDDEDHGGGFSYDLPVEPLRAATKLRKKIAP